MALSLAACGGSDDVAVDLTPFNQADIDAAVNTVTVELTAVNDELTAANIADISQRRANNCQR